ncbi:hypothetical protein [Streptomyces noursei]|uniref:hypothetical protein n=1 Tax=Streptomyces noursei TaxID=1971 RepID=UPI0021A65F18|nr:hypothetical protein [Streptomyces noursei]UWS69811.1 hypothetical protein N1H47_00020 [Streptomyces noursei]UWS76968.1 hypothetical protein N1H47_40500 [Streptomyces noursei]
MTEAAGHQSIHQDEAFAPAWRRLPRPRGKDAVPPITSPQTAARAVTGERLVFTNPDRPARTDGPGGA